MAGQIVGLIWAQASDGVIGRDGGMPWHSPQDMAHFKATTMGHPVIMGRRTWESIPPRFRPFSGRTNIVLTRDPSNVEDASEAGAFVCETMESALHTAREAPGGELTWIVGGGSVYAAAVGLADLAVITVFDLDVSGDTFAPQLPDDFVLTGAEPREGFTPSDHGPAFRFETWTRASTA